jgi:hypothetical protein
MDVRIVAQGVNKFDKPERRVAFLQLRGLKEVEELSIYIGKRRLVFWRKPRWRAAWWRIRS